MQDIVARVPTLSFIDIGRRARLRARRAARTPRARSPPATASRCRRASRAITSGAIARRGASPAARNGSSPSRRSSRSARATIKYMISFALPRFCDQSLDRSRKERFYPGAEPWIAKLDTVVHELYHIDPELARHPPDRARRRHLLGQLPRPAVLRAGRRHGARLSRRRSPIAGRLRLPAPRFRRRSTRATAASSATSFRTFPSFPQRYIERARASSCRASRTPTA